MMRKISAAVMLLWPLFLMGQVNKKTTDYGVPYAIKPGTPEGSYRLTGIDNISIYSGKLSVALPILEIGARGEARYTVTVNATLPSWNYELELKSDPCEPGTPNIEPATYYYLNKATSLWWTGHRARYGPGAVVYRRSGWGEARDTNNNSLDPYGELYYTNTTGHVVFLGPDGTEQVLYDNRALQEAIHSQSNYQTDVTVRKFFSARDGSGITFEAETVLPDYALVRELAGNETALPSGRLRFPNGNQYYINGGRVEWIEDRNGNKLTFEYQTFTDALDTNSNLTTFRITRVIDSIGRETLFSYGESKVIDGQNSTVDVIRFKGSNGDQREIFIERKLVTESLAPPLNASSSLFPGVTQPGGTNTIYTKVPRTIILPNGKQYRILYNEYGEVARIELPTGGRFEYQHGPAFETDSTKGSFGGGRMLSAYGIVGGTFGGCTLRPAGNPIWQPFIYRRLLEKRVYTSSNASAGEWVTKTNYYANEALGSVQRYPNNDNSSNPVRSVASSYGGAISVREESAVSVGSTSNLRWHRHYFVASGATLGCENSDAATNGGWLGPFAGLQCDKAAPPTSSANPRTEDGKEYRTEWGSDAGGNNMTALKRSETNFIQVADRSFQACWQKTTELDGTAKSKRSAMFYDRSGTSALPSGSTDNQAPLTTNFIWSIDSVPGSGTEPTDAKHFFSNLSDTFEWDWNSGPDYTGTFNAIGSCPLMNAVSLSGYARRRHEENWASASGKESYRRWNAQLVRLESESVTTNGSGVVAAQALVSFDDTGLEGSPSSVGSVAVSHPRGNATRERVKKSGSAEMLTETWYDANGQRTRVRDAGGNEASFSYADNFTSNTLPGGTNGFLRTLTYPVAKAGETALTESWKVDPYLGMPVEAAAKNGIVTAYTWNDALGRLKSIERTPGIAATQQKSVVSYEDSYTPQRVSTRGARLTALDEGARSYICYDGLGREVKTLSRVSATAWDVVDKVYSGFGEAMRVSNPYRVAPTNEPSDGSICDLGGTGQIWNNTLYDDLGRVKQEQAAGQASTSYTYAPGSVTLQDPAGKVWRRDFDGLGRLVKVVEEVGGANDETSYVYDAADRLTTVTQGVQTRSFVYNWAGQLLSATNPESGTTSYQYDAEGNLIAKLDARGAGSCAGVWSGTVCDGSGVDGLGRIVRKTYLQGSGAATQEVVYCFDGKKPVKLTGPDRVECNSTVVNDARGFLTGVGNLASRTEYEHDVAGRVTRSLQLTEGSTAGSRAVEYQYWASDRVKKTKYPSGREVVECLDGRLRMVWASGVKTEGDCSAGTAVAAADAYVTGAEYAAHGALERWQLGNGLWEVAQFNDRLQMSRKRIGQTNAAQACGVAADDELCLEWGYGSASANNGNVMEAKQWSRKTAGGYLNLQSTFTYDGRNRLSAFNETVLGGGTSGGAWGQTNGYDRYGNRWATGTSQSDATPEQQSRIDVATNRVVTAKLGAGSQPITYDAAGFMLTSPHVAGTLAYDAEGRQVASGTAVYVYDGEGRRVKKVAGGVTSWFWYGADGAMVAEDTTEAQEGGRQYLHVDALGSTRLVTKADKSVAARMDYWPFGEEVAGTSLYGNRDLVSGYTSASAVKQRFTGKERDPENGFDYFGARYYAGVMGRWTSPDAPWADQFAEDPQSWNIYSYARNNPLKYVDPDGNAIETAWDVANIAMGVASLAKNVASGNLVGAAVDVVGIAVDTAAAVVPGLPGGAGTGIKALRAADKLADAGQAAKKAATLAENSKLGKAVEEQAVKALKKDHTGVVEQLSVKTKSGVRTKLDAAGKNADGNVALTEVKGSATAPLTKNQKKAFPEIEKSGATVIGKGKPGFPPGTQIPPTKVNVVRPADLNNMKK